MARIAFIQNIWAEILGVLSLSAALKRAGHQTRVFIEPGEKNLLAEVAAWTPDLIAFSVCTGTHQWALRTAAALKQSLKTPIIMGGNHPTLVPTILNNPAVDLISRGESEAALVELARCLDHRSSYTGLDNLGYKAGDTTVLNPLRPLLEDLDSLPFMDRELYRTYRHFRLQSQWPVITARGCPHECAYCHNHVKKALYEGKGTYVRQRSVGHVIEELSSIKARYPFRYVFFWDDSFGLDKDWFYQLLAEYRSKIGVPFWCFIAPSHYDADMISELKASGCRMVPLAIETGSERLRMSLLGKDFTPNDTYIQMAEWLHRYGIPFGTLNMLGLPGETLEDSFETMRLNWRLKPRYAWSLMFQPYPQTKLYHYCLEHGFITEADIDRIGPHWYNSSVVRQPQITEQINLHKLFNLGVQRPGLEPLLKRLISLPRNPLFDLVYLAGYGRYNRFVQDLNFRQFLTVTRSGSALWKASALSNQR